MNNIRLIRTAATATILVLAFSLLLAACRKDESFDRNPSTQLAFSTDTVMFDTVFTTIGSVTRDFRIYNNTGKKVEISSIRLARGQNSPYRINVDGISAQQMNNISINAHDSLYVFVRANINPNDINAPLIQTDSIVFETNGNVQDVKLVAWGQDAHFYNQAIIKNDITFTNDKPHVIYNMLAIDSLYTLTIQPGTKIYLHNNATLLIYRDASLKVLGSADEPVIFDTDRREENYRDVPGQWNRIWLYPGSKDNVIDHAIIRNGVIGVQVNAEGTISSPVLQLTNTVIENMQGIGVYAQSSWVEAANCLISDCGMYGVALAQGGYYDFRHTTIANYYKFGGRETPSLILNNYVIGENKDTIPMDLVNAYFGNCIVYGNQKSELGFSNTQQGAFNYTFDHCLIKNEKELSGDAYINTLFNEDPRFTDTETYNYHLDTIISPAVNAASLEVISGAVTGDLTTDLDGVARPSGEGPDLGAYEFVPKR